MKIMLFALLMPLLGPTSLRASEIDPFRDRAELMALTDMSAKINEKGQEFLLESLSYANKRPGCDEDRLYRGLRKSFRNHIFGKLSPYIIESEEIERQETRTRQSIYRDFSWYEAVIPGFYARFNDPAGKILNMNGVLIGTDKFEHFMGTGFNYFKHFYLEGGNLRSVLMKGWKLETGFMGGMTTGVQSYSDMVANFNGMRFWNHMLQKNEDILGENLGPYLACENQRWVQRKQIDWGHYVDPSWDEAINCSKFRNKRLLRKVEAVIAEYQKESAIELTCPIESEDIYSLMEEKYHSLPSWSWNFLFNFKGHGVVEKDPN